MSLFAEYRAAVGGDPNVGEFRLYGWAKTFRIMLGKYPVEEGKAVIAALRGLPDCLSTSRYRNAYDLNRSREWEDLKPWIKTHELKKAMEVAQPQVVPSPKANADDWVDEDDDDSRPTRKLMAWASDYSSWEGIMRRRARYAARAAEGDLDKRPRRGPQGMPLFRPGER